jgi:FtsH-binding integral membrane protein
MSDDNQIMGFIPKGDYVKYAYYLLLVATAGATVLSLLAMLNVYIPLGQLFQLAFVVGLVMALLGFFIFKSEFSSLDQAHLLYMSVVVGCIFIVGLIFSNALGITLMMVHVVTLLVVIAELLAVWTGYNSWKNGRTITKANIQEEIKLALKRG